MIGKTLYKAKLRRGKIVVEDKTIVEEKRKYYYFDGDKRCLKSDVGVVCFLTKQEALDFLIRKLRRSIKMGDEYITKERLLLAEALNFPVN